MVIKLPKLPSLSAKAIVLTLFALLLLMQGANLASNLLFANNSNVKPPSGERDPNIAMQEHIAKLERQIAELTSRLAQQQPPTPSEPAPMPATPPAPSVAAIVPPQPAPILTTPPPAVIPATVPAQPRPTQQSPRTAARPPQETQTPASTSQPVPSTPSGWVPLSVLEQRYRARLEAEGRRDPFLPPR